MAERREFEQRYAKLWRSIVNFIKNNTGLRVSGIARAGSRKKGTHHNRSDLDIIFTVAGDPRKENIYPMIASNLKYGFPKAHIKIGSSYNVINMKIEDLDFNIVLLTEEEFKKEVKENELEEFKS